MYLNPGGDKTLLIYVQLYFKIKLSLAGLMLGLHPPSVKINKIFIGAQVILISFLICISGVFFPGSSILWLGFPCEVETPSIIGSQKQDFVHV